ncbi:ankyrin repeat-containing domain protein [Lasiosphaeria ovina]|uniref:Ankyrin repeat-containing domain protein n=1 Tax=Lasiosphaeria ovina TaxID=92902 RepID=A0AAE0JXG0_9PEZI|nr:ankyrin repeat-containing domain protein [Lasiosphaeria ovina]
MSSGMEMVTALLSAGALLKGGELVSAVYLGIEFVEQLLFYGAAASTKTRASEIGILEAAVMSGDSAIMAMVDEWHPALYEAGALCAAIATQREPEYIGALLRRPLEATAVAMAVTAKSSHLLQLLLRYLPPSNRGVLPSRSWKPGEHLRLWLPFWRLYTLEGSPLVSAAQNQDEHTIRRLLDHGFRPDWGTFKALAETRHTELARILTDDAHLPSESVRRVAYGDSCPLYTAVSNGDVEILRLLLTIGLNIDDNGSRYTAFQRAVECAKLDMMQILLEAGANINAPASGCFGATALQIAAIKGHLGIAKQLLDLGADPNARRAASNGRTALEGAAEHGRIDMIELLLQHGAKTTGNRRR